MVQGIDSGSIPNLLTLLKNIGGMMLKPGQVFLATIVAREGNLFFLQVGDQRLPVRAEIDLTVGQRLKLQVLEQHGAELLVRNLSIDVLETAKHNNREQMLSLILEKYGFKGDSILHSLLDNVRKIPTDEQTAVRYLLDPSVYAALLILSENNQEQVVDRLEIKRYKSGQGKEEYWEVVFELQLPVLGRLELNLKMIQQKIYLQIWAESVETEIILQEKKNIMADFCFHMEIVSPTEGPLIKVDNLQSIDIVV